jgi:hypothetical protein
LTGDRAGEWLGERAGDLEVDLPGLSYLGDLPGLSYLGDLDLNSPIISEDLTLLAGE